jgi:hypothetical protein
MFLDEISIQTSILIYAGLGFVFFLGFGYYFFKNPIKNSHSLSWSIILGCLRGLILASLLFAIFPFKSLKNSNLKDSNESIFIVDFPEIMTKDFDKTFRKVDSILKIKYSNLIWLDFKGQVVHDFKKPFSVSRSLISLNQTLRKFNNVHSNKDIFVLTDGNLNDLNIELNSNIHLISYGMILNKEQIEFSTSYSAIFSVPNEVVHLPIEVWVKNFKQNKYVTIQIYIDGIFFKKQKILFDKDHTFLISDFELKSDQLGKHKIKVFIDHGVTTFKDWNVVKQKAVVYGFSDALDPDVGVLNRVAKNKFIQLIWNYDVNAKIPDQNDKFIFMHVLPKETIKSKILNSSVLFLNTPKDKVELYFNHAKSSRHLQFVKESLWDLQIKEFQFQGTYAQSDSTVGAWFDFLFLDNTNFNDSLNKDRSALADDAFTQRMSNNSMGRNEPKLSFLANKNNIDLLEIDELATANFSWKEQNSNFRVESVYVRQNVYFKLGLLVLILTEWFIRKFKELR